MSRRFGTVPLEAARSWQSRQTPRDNEQFEPLPAQTGQPPYRLDLSDVTADPTDTLQFIVMGDTGGVSNPAPQQAVAAAAAKAVTSSPVSFVYHVGDLVYFNGDDSQWYPQFYEPYNGVGVPILGIPGNHDGDSSPGTTSLQAFVENMCAPSPVLTVDAGDSDRDAMTQPNCYWTLRATLATIIGLYTNVPSGGVVMPSQAAWFASELAAAPAGVPVIVALHHPPFSCDAMHGGSATMGGIIDAAAAEAGRWPDLVLSGHVHNYQSFTRTVPASPNLVGQDTKQVPYVVIGNGGYHNLHAMAADIGTLPWTTPDPTVTLDAYDATNWGYLTVTISGSPPVIQLVYQAVPAPTP